MTPVPEMDARLYHAVQCALGRVPDSLYDLKRVKLLNDFSYDGDPYYQEHQGDQEPGDFSAIGTMENLHTLLFGTPRSQRIPTVSVQSFSFLPKCRRLKKLDLRWTDFSDCALLLQLPALKQVRLPARERLRNVQALEELAGRSVSVELLPPSEAPAVQPSAPAGESVRAVVEEIKSRTAMDCLALRILPGSRPGLLDSKLGGLPYWPEGMDYPRDSAGEKLILLAQFDLGQLPPLPPLPQRGLLQFFAGRGDLFGADWGNGLPWGYRVVYHGHIDRSLTPERVRAMDIPTHASLDYWPVMTEAAVSAEKTTLYMGPPDGRFDGVFRQAWEKVTGQILENGTDFRDVLPDADRSYLYDQLWSSGHHLLGYPTFDQFDPREEDSPYDTLLFQLDSDWTGDRTYVMWASGGAGQFFIPLDKLKRQDFSDVFYTWDCG